MKAAVVISKATRTVLGCDGINLIQSNGEAAGQDVFHFHLHIKPRWHGDGVNMAWDNTPVVENKKNKLYAEIWRALH